MHVPVYLYIYSTLKKTEYSDEILHVYFCFCFVKTPEEQLVLYWKSRLTLNLMNEDFIFSNAGVPSDLRRYMKM